MKGGDEMIKRNILESKMKLFGDKQEDLANAIGITPQALNRKLNERNEFTRNEIQIIVIRYRLTAEELCEIFFITVVSDADT